MYNRKIIIIALSVIPYISEATDRIGINDTTHIYGLDEVVVTTKQKDLQTLRNQAVSSTSLSAKMIQVSSAQDLHDIATYIPSFVMPSYGTRYTSTTYVRGIGSRVNSPAFGIYIDDIPIINKSAFNTHLYNISHIDILRGPQGTLYGQNTEGGLVRIYTKDPSTHQGTDFKFSLGSYLRRMAEVNHYANIDNLGTYSISAFYDGDNGFQKYSNTKKHADDSNEAGARLKFIRQQSENIQISLSADYQWVRQHGFAYGIYNINDNTIDDPATNFPNSYKRDLFTLGLSVSHNCERFDLKSTTSYQYINDCLKMDQDFLPVNYLSLKQKQLINAITEETSIKSHSTGIWNWLTGMFFCYQWLKTDAPVGFGDGITGPIGIVIRDGIYNGIIKAMTSKGLPETIAKNIVEKSGGVNMNISLVAPGIFKTPNLNAAIYHESTLQVLPRLRATIALRYDLSHVSVDYNTRAMMTINASVMKQKATNTLSSHYLSKTSNTFNELLPKIGFTYTIGDIQNGNGKLGNIYASINKGYRAGGYNIQMFSDVMQTELMLNKDKAMSGSYEIKHTKEDINRINNTIAYKPEISWNYEIGTHLNLLSSSVHLDIATYMMQIKNQQLSIMAGTYGFGRMMVNAGRSRSLGVEASLRGISLSDALVWSIAYGYTNAKFRKYKDGNTNYDNKNVPYVPSHTLSANTDYSILPRQSTIKCITIGISTTTQGKIYWNEANTYKQNFYALLNAHVLVQTSKLSINLWAKNLTGTKFCTFAMDSSASGEKKYFGQKGAPFRLGLDISYKM